MPEINPSKTAQCQRSVMPDGTGWTRRTTNQANPNVMVSSDGCWERPKTAQGNTPPINPSKLPKCLQSAMPDDGFEWTRKTSLQKAAGQIDSPDGCWERPLNRPSPRIVRAGDLSLKPETKPEAKPDSQASSKPQVATKQSSPAATPSTPTQEQMPQQTKLGDAIKVLIALACGSAAGVGTQIVSGSKETKHSVIAGVGTGAVVLAALYAFA